VPAAVREQAVTAAEAGTRITKEEADRLIRESVSAALHDYRAEHAEAIRVLGRRVAGDIIEIGNRLIAVRERLPHGRWLPWLDQEFGWGETTARKFMAVAESFGESSLSVDLPIDASALYALAGPTVPPAVRGRARELVEDPAEQAVIAEIRAMRAQGETLMAIRDEMRARGHRVSHSLVADLCRRGEAA
jgi:hypothetical protein